MPPTDAALDPDQLRRLLRARDRMGAAPAAAWPVARCAKVAGMSASHFARAFKAAFGAPPHRYLLSLRLERAMALLRDTGPRGGAGTLPQAPAWGWALLPV